jgi:hypothetical protein
MQATFARYALDRIPLSLIIDDSTVLVNLNYFWMRDRNPVDGQNRRWEDVPAVHPESFTREFGEFCLASGVRGKFSVVPCPAALGRIDEGLPLFSRQQQESWLGMCREVIRPAFDITPEMITHSVVVDPRTCRPVEPQIWEQYEWETLPTDQEELVFEYIATACRILDNVGLTPEGVTSPGGFGGKTLEFYAKVAGEATRSVSGDPAPYFFKRVMDEPITETERVEVPVWYADPQAGTATGEIIASTGDWTGSWTGYGEVDADRYLTADLQGGRVAELIAAGQPVVFCSHWQGFYGLHNEDRKGFEALQTVVARMKELDPHGERTRWRKCGEITRYACATAMADLRVKGQEVRLRLPLVVPEVTLELTGVRPVGLALDGKPLRQVTRKTDFASGTWLAEGDRTLVAFDPGRQQTTLTVTT